LSANLHAGFATGDLSDLTDMVLKRLIASYGKYLRNIDYGFSAHVSDG
jgi:hypothetical protein